MTNQRPHQRLHRTPVPLVPFLQARPTRPRPRVGKRVALRLGAALVSLASVLILAGVWSLGRSAETSRRAQVAAQLAVSLGSALREADSSLRELDARADVLARDPAFQEALARGDTAALGRLASAQEGVIVELGERRLGAELPGLRLAHEVALTRDGRPIGRVVAFAPVDELLYDRLARATPHGEGYRLLVVQDGAVLQGWRRGLQIRPVAGNEADIAGVRFLLRSGSVPGSSVELVAAVPTTAVGADVRDFQIRLLLAAFGSLALLTALAAVLGGPIVRALGELTRVAKEAETDALTGVANRRSFDVRLAVEARRAKDIGLPLSLILFDLDHFKAINDEHGHQAGDEVLRRLGALLQDRLRGTDFGARYGGEEFAVLLPDTDRDGAMLLAERLRAAVSELRVAAGDGEVSPTASFGVAAFPEHPISKLVAAADAALYEAKRSGRNRSEAAARAR